ncbi:MAG: phosphotransferase [Tepidiformaceae bacterium]
MEPLLGGEISAIDELLNYGYRAAWKVTAGGERFMVKVDLRSGFQTREVEAQAHARSAGVPVAEAVLSRDGDVPALAMRWVEGGSLRGCASLRSWQAAGAVLRLAHGAPSLRPAPEPPGAFVAGWLKRELPYLVAHHGFAAADAELVLRHAERLRPTLDHATPAWLHGDCQAAHFLLEPAGDRIAAVLDWADAHEGDPVMDFAVLTLFDREALLAVLDGYEASGELRDRVALSLPLYRAARGAGAVRWLDAHGYPEERWPLDALRQVAALEAAR